MNKPTLDIERVVREVLAELGAAPARNNGEGGRGKGEKTADSSVFVVASRVVTMADLVGRWDSIRRLAVLRDAIVTPAVRDELDRRGIVLEYADSAQAERHAIHLTIATAGTDFDTTALAAALAREGLDVERPTSDGLASAVDALAAAVLRPDTLGVLVTGQLAAGLCLANRLRGVRAVAAESASAAPEIGANVLVADPRAMGFFRLRQIIAQFARGGVLQCPAAYCERLA
jgi:hypothetical protein